MRKSKLGPILFGIVLFFFFFVLMFPYQNLRGYIFGKIYTATNILIVADDIYPSLLGWPGIGIKNVNITLPIGQSELELASEKVLFKVGLGHLFPPAPSVSLNMKKLRKGGDLYIKFVQSKPTIKVVLDAEEVALEQLSLSGAPESFSGTLDSEVNLTINDSDLSKSTGKIEINASKVKTSAQTIQMSETYSFLIPDMNIGKITARLNIKNGALEFTEVKLGSDDSDLSGSLTGDIRLGNDYKSSHLNLTLRLTLSSRILQNPQAKTFTGFLGGYQTSEGNYAMRWNANISDFTNFSINALPQRVQ